MPFLYDILTSKTGKHSVSIPGYLTDNLKFEIRDYQKEAFLRYFYHESEFSKKPVHLLYNMATGSGKTLVMAGLILHLYNKGYRNFLFFVHSNNIIEKTKNNFLNPHATKYLFVPKIFIDGREIQVKEVQNFDEADAGNINIKFTTIQQLHNDLNSAKENNISYRDFEDKEIVMIADEAHHLSSTTKNKKDTTESWENTVMNILRQNSNNILLEFTATLDFNHPEIVKKYRNKIIYKYDLSEFRKDGYSKEINLFRSLYDEPERIIQALLLNLYRQELANSHGINLKPVILFKAKRTIKESEQNKENFHLLIDKLSPGDIEKIKKTSTSDIIQKAFNFFEKSNLSLPEIVTRIKINFKEANCISANNDKETERNQILLNTLEDINNPVRAIFAVEKLNEGWDVLNLFDIVRLYGGRDGKNGKPGKTTISEAQLIGRGARYFPFKLDNNHKIYRRKFDHQPDNDLKILEELYYHTREDNRYISELKTALIQTGIYQDDNKYKTKTLVLKPGFKNTTFYQNAQVVFNKKLKKDRSTIQSLSDVNILPANFTYVLSSGSTKMESAFGSLSQKEKHPKTYSKTLKLISIPPHIVRFALSKFPFFRFDNLQKYFPHLKSLTEFIQSDKYLAEIKIHFIKTGNQPENISNATYLKALTSLLENLEKSIQQNLTEYENSGWIFDDFKNIFKDRKIRIKAGNTSNDKFPVKDKPWYVYQEHYGNKDEIKFLQIFAEEFEKYKDKHNDIYLVKNENQLKIYNSRGKNYMPDYLLLSAPKSGNDFYVQAFIKISRNLSEHQQWHHEMISFINNNPMSVNIKPYKIEAFSFHNNNEELKQFLSRIFK